MPASDRAALDPGSGLFSADGHVHGNHVLVEAIAGYLRTSTKTAGQDVADHFSGDPYGWQTDLLRYVAAAMFVDGKISAIDRAGKRYDDPRAQGVRALFGTAAFKGLRLEIEEDALAPAESNQARSLLVDLGEPPTDGGEVSLKEATLQLATRLTKRLAVIEKAKLANLPLPASYTTVGTALEALSMPASPVKVVRTLLAQAQELKYATTSLKRLEEFESHNGLEQYRRSQQLLQAARQAGLADDPVHGETIRRARDEIEALKQQARYSRNGTRATRTIEPMSWTRSRPCMCHSARS